jgi:hypothetical protein
MRKNLLGGPAQDAAPPVNLLERVRRRWAREQKSVALAGEEKEKEAEKVEREQVREPDRTPAQRGAGCDLLGARGARHGLHSIETAARRVKRGPPPDAWRQSVKRALT